MANPWVSGSSSFFSFYISSSLSSFLVFVYSVLGMKDNIYTELLVSFRGKGVRMVNDKNALRFGHVCVT